MSDQAMTDEESLVCLCHCVTKAQIRNAIREKNLETLDQIKNEVAASTGCGGCTFEVEEILSEELLLRSKNGAA